MARGATDCTDDSDCSESGAEFHLPAGNGDVGELHYGLVAVSQSRLTHRYSPCMRFTHNINEPDLTEDGSSEIGLFVKSVEFAAPHSIRCSRRWR